MLISHTAPMRLFASAGIGALCLVLLAMLASCRVIGDGRDTGAADETAPPGDYNYITEVFEYVYGPGQHAASSQLSGDGMQDAENLIGTSSDFVLLGGWGGYIVAGFGSDVANIPGKHDFAVFTQPGPGDEPGVVYVMSDHNGSGQPDGTWYELRGSESDEAGYIRDYEVTYYRPDNETANITWSDNYEGAGELVPGYPEGASSYSWWWDGYGDVAELTLSGVLLPDSMYEDDGIWREHESSHSWGYAENYNADDLYRLPFGSRTRSANVFDIGNAVDADGQPVALEHIRFIKVQTGVFQIAGWLNEISTEISGAVNLHAEEIAELITWQ